MHVARDRSYSSPGRRRALRCRPSMDSGTRRPRRSSGGTVEALAQGILSARDGVSPDHPAWSNAIVADHRLGLGLTQDVDRVEGGRPTRRSTFAAAAAGRSSLIKSPYLGLPFFGSGTQLFGLLTSVTAANLDVNRKTIWRRLDALARATATRFGGLSRFPAQKCGLLPTGLLCHYPFPPRTPFPDPARTSGAALCRARRVGRGGGWRRSA